MTHGSLFSGIGGFDLAAEWMGWENKFHCEWNEFGQKVLNYYWPNAKSYGDITKTDFNVWRGKIDILTGGFPCQPFSAAGKRKGKEDDRHLWPQMLRAIREIQPHWVVGENVLGLLNWNNGLVFHEVQTDLEAAGFITFPYVLPACAKDAPHRRDRVWIVAHSNSERYDTTNRAEKGILDRQERKGSQQSGNGRWSKISGFNDEQVIANTNCNGQQRGNSEHEINASERGQHALSDIKQVDSNTKRKGLEGRGWKREGFEQGLQSDKWANWPTQSPLCGGDDGLQSELVGITVSKHRTESIKGYGNAIVPQVAFEIFKTIEQYENNTIPNHLLF